MTTDSSKPSEPVLTRADVLALLAELRDVHQSHAVVRGDYSRGKADAYTYAIERVISRAKWKGMQLP